MPLPSDLRRREIVSAALLMSTLAGCGGGGGGGGGGAILPLVPPPAGGDPPAPPAPPPAPAAGRTESFSLQAANGQTYPIEVYLPSSYATADRPLPSIYATDADATFVSTAAEPRFAQFRRALEGSGKQALLIGIGNTRNRGVDYLLPGATAYHEFLVKDLVPLIESRYRADPKIRLLSGLSYGGFFVVAALWLEALSQMVFSHFLSSDGFFVGEALTALNQLEARVVDEARDRGVAATLLLAYGSIQPNYSSAVQAYRERLRGLDLKNLQVLSTSIPGDHGTMDVPAFEDALARFIA